MSVNPRTAGSHQSANPAAAGTRQKILVVDDDPDITWFIKVALAYDNVEVLRDHDGQRGVWSSVQEHPDLIITDLEMPRRNGFELIKFVRSHSELSGVPILVITGVEGPEAAQKATAVGANGLIRKPIDLKAFRRELERWIELRPAHVGV